MGYFRRSIVLPTRRLVGPSRVRYLHHFATGLACSRFRGGTSGKQNNSSRQARAIV